MIRPVDHQIAYGVERDMTGHGWQRVSGCLITGNEDGGKHCGMNIRYSLQHLRFTIPPQAESYWVGETGPDPSLSRRRLRWAGQ